MPFLRLLRLAHLGPAARFIRVAALALACGLGPLLGAESAGAAEPFGPPRGHDAGGRHTQLVRRAPPRVTGSSIERLGRVERSVRVPAVGSAPDAAGRSSVEATRHTEDRGRDRPFTGRDGGVNDGTPGDTDDAPESAWMAAPVARPSSGLLTADRAGSPSGRSERAPASVVRPPELRPPIA